MQRRRADLEVEPGFFGDQLATPEIQVGAHYRQRQLGGALVASISVGFTTTRLLPFGHYPP
ncbi:hypothetical protein SBA2_270027 [Acidobacteriia bacterium SbA2]|nr:hypothetical protein SBA2_270027 [Acidobacteriia bacterium SbA2]